MIFGFMQEVIQNAEDAGATRVVFLIDHTTYGTDPSQLYEPRLAQFQVYSIFKHASLLGSNASQANSVA